MNKNWNGCEWQKPQIINKNKIHYIKNIVIKIAEAIGKDRLSSISNLSKNSIKVNIPATNNDNKRLKLNK